MSLSDNKPLVQSLVNLGIIVFIGFSLVNLYYSIKVNRRLLEKETE